MNIFRPIVLGVACTMIFCTGGIGFSEPQTTNHVTEIVDTDVYPITADEIELIALVTMAEAGVESEYGKRLVIDTILNRVDSRRFPNSVYDVVYQPNQFSVMWNGMIERCWVDNDICELVKEELLKRTNYDVIFFRMEKYSKWGTPLFKVGNHYFSSYDN